MAIAERGVNTRQTAFGTTRDRSNLAIFTKSGTASGISLQNTLDEEWVLWVDSNGKLEIGTRSQWINQSGGTIVGSQS